MDGEGDRTSLGPAVGFALIIAIFYRGWSPIGTALAAFFTFLIARRLHSTRAGLMAMGLLALNPLMAVEAVAATTDALVIFTLAVTKLPHDILPLWPALSLVGPGLTLALIAALTGTMVFRAFRDERYLADAERRGGPLHLPTIASAEGFNVAKGRWVKWVALCRACGR